MSRFKKTGICVLAAVMVLALASGAFAQNVRQQLSSESTIEQVLKRGVLRVGFSTFVPWAMKDKTGKIIGLEIDVARRLAKDMGVKLELVPTKWSGIIPALLTGKFDVIIGGMGIRPDRNLKVNFTIPYYYTGMSLVASRQKAKGFNSLDDFNKPGVVLAARLGTTAASAAKKYMPKAKLKLFDDESQAMQELLNGRVHAVIASAPMPAFQAIKFSKRLFLPIKGTFTKEPIGFAVRKGDVDTINFLNNWITLIRSENWMQERHDYWFTTRDWEKFVK